VFDVSALDAENDLLGLAAGVVMEVEPSVDSLVSTAPNLSGRARANQRQRPRLELELVVLGKLAGSGDVGRFAVNLVGAFDGLAELILQTLFDEADGKVGYVDADPAAVQALGSYNGSAASTERIEDDIAFV
jgi:hypothetical protein